jgi:hypothetical protein
MSVGESTERGDAWWRRAYRELIAVHIDRELEGEEGYFGDRKTTMNRSVDLGWLGLAN